VNARVAEDKARHDQEVARQAQKDAQGTYEARVKDLASTNPTNQQPHFGPAGGLHVTFVTPPSGGAPSGSLQVKIASASVIGPIHGHEPLRVWMWVLPTSSFSGGCTPSPNLLIANAFCDYSTPPWTIPVPTNLDVSKFIAGNMIVTPGTSINIVGIIQEKQSNPTRVTYRFHASAALPVPAAPTAQETLCDVIACPNDDATPPN
jgi:hypothetical protein